MLQKAWEDHELKYHGRSCMSQRDGSSKSTAEHVDHRTKKSPWQVRLSRNIGSCYIPSGYLT